MKRPPGLWLLLTIVAVWLKVDNVYSIKATALIFGKTTTTTTVPDVSESASEGGVTETSSTESDGQNTTKHQLTGNPQIDYIWDPNLPRELNGYNLSEYPFYDGLPKDINFKCDGLHDGFYASVPHKCQVYHHCLFGVRYDFLCANYTAFDQKTFICHFVSEVDCVNSKKFWHRNDALYQAASTTTVKPSTTAYTLPPPVAPAVPIVPILSRRPDRPRRPPARRRPYDYYEDEYEEDDYYEKPMRRQRPRYRPRVYDEEYDYEEDDYARRSNGRRNENRRPYKPRGSNRRRPYDDEEYQDEEETRRPDSSRRNNDDTRRPSKRRPIEDDEYDRRTYDRPRKKGYRRPIDEEYEDDPPPRRSSDRRKNKNRDDSRKYEEEEEDRPRKSSRKNNDRNRNEDPVDEDILKNRNDKERNRDRNRNDEPVYDDKANKNRERNKNDDASYDDRPLSKPPTSIYSRQRPMVSKIRPPVPAHEQARYSPKVPKTTTPQPTDEEYYDDYEEDIEKKEESPRSYKDNNQKSTSPIQSSVNRGYENKRKESDDEAGAEVDTSTRKYDIFGTKERRNNFNNRKRPTLPEYEDNEETNSQNTKNNERKISPTTISTTISTTTKEPSREPVIKVVKRPFLPSRGGSPYTSRGLLPVGSKAPESSDANQDNSPEPQNSNQDEQLENKELPKQAPVVVKIPNRNKYVNNDEDFRPISNRPVTRIVKLTTTTTTTEKPKVIEKDPFDEYDVTLNDALNPTLPNLPVRNFPTGFSSQNDYTYNTLQRPRYVIDPVINQASSDYVYRIEQPEALSNNIRYRSIPVYQNFRQSPKVTQAFYSPY